MPHLSLRTRPARAARLPRTLFVCCLLASFVLTPAAPVVAAAPDVAVPAAAGMAGAALPRAGAPSGSTDQVGEPPLVPDPNWPRTPPDPATAPPAPMWDMGTAAPELPPLVPAPVLLDVSSPAAVVAAGTPFTVAVSVSPSRADAPLPAGLTAHVQVPRGAAALDPANSPLDWVLPLLAPGTAHTQTVQLVADGSAPLLGIEATVSGAGVLPVVQTQWFVVAPAGAAAIDAAEAQAAPASGANDLAGAATTLGAQGAVVQSLAGGVTLALPHDAAPSGAVVHYTPRFDWRSAPPVPPAADATPAPQVTQSPEAPAAPGAHVFLPGIFGGGSDVQIATASQAADALAPGRVADPQASNPNVASVQEDGITFYALWELGAEVVAADDATSATDGSAAAATTSEATARAAGEVAQLQTEALLVVDVADLSAAGVNPRRLQVWTREETTEPWTPLQARYDDDAHVLRAWLPHFSQFGLGEGLTPSGDQLPNVEAFTADILSGGASASVPFETPAGLGGLKPNLGLSYSSVTMDDLYLAGGDNAMTAQAGAGGFGWNLGGLSYIVRTDGKGDDDTLDGDKTFALVLNGERMAVTFVDAHWHTNPEIFAQISWAGRVLSETRDYAGWTVTTVDGVRYDFGDAFAYEGFRQDSATAYAPANTNGNESFCQGRRWYLRQVTDPHGNSMEYHYKTERAYKTCQVESNWVSNGWNWYTSSVDPLEITWSGNPGQGVDYKLRALFVYSTTARTDTQVENWAPGSCNAAYAAQPLVGLWNRLSGLVVQVKDLSGNWQLLRSYDLVQGSQTFNAPTAKQRPYLSSVSARGQGGGLLRKYSFTYAFSNLNQVWLTKADNGWGGSVTYSYEDYRVSCAATVCNDRNLRYPISTTVAYDGPSGWARNSVQTNYFYGADNAGSEGGAVADDRGFLGFKLVEITHTEVNSPTVVLQREEVRSYEDGAGASRDNPDPRHGKVKERKLLDANGNVLQVTSYDWQAYWFLSGAWSATPTGTSWRMNNGRAEYPPTWIRLESETVTQGPLNAAGVPVNSSVYAYAQAQQNGGQYGNRTHVRDYVDGVLKRETVTEYFPNTDEHIVNRPARVRVYDAAGACVSEVRSVYDRYDDSNNYQTAPTYGLLSETATALVACSDTAALPKGDAGWQASVLATTPMATRPSITW